MSVMSQDMLRSRENLNITSLNQLQDLYGKSKPSDIAQSLVFGDKIKKKENRPVKQNTEPAYKTFCSTQSMASLPPSKLTQLSNQLFNHVSHTLEAHKSQRAFHYKDENLLLSPQRMHSLPGEQKVKADQSNRLLEQGTFINDKKKVLKEQLDQERLAECSFQPQIDPKSRQLAIKSTNKEIRSADSFHENQMKHLQNCQEKRDQALKMQQEILSSELSSPQLNPKSLKLALKHTQVPLVERLNVRLSRSVQIEEPSYSFKPEISKKSKQLTREVPVDDFLYKDAKLRQQVKYVTETTVPESVIQPTDKSQQWFVQRFIKEFYYQLSGIERIQQSKDYSKINQEEMNQILQGLQFGESEELWNKLNQGFHVLSRNLLVALLAILAVPLAHIEIPLYKPKSEENIQIKSQFKIDENGNLILSETDCQLLHRQFYKLYLNTKLQQGNGIRRQQARSPQQQQRCGSPQILKRSEELASVKRNTSNIHEWFDQYEQKKKENLEKKKDEVLKEEMKECKTISRPITINFIDLAKPLQKQSDKTAVDIEFESQQQHCTFQPSISKAMKPVQKCDRVNQEIEKQAQRMNEARVRQKTLDSLKQKGTTTNNNIRIKQKQVTEITLKNQPKKQKQKSKPLFENVPLLFVDVNIEDGKTARITVFDGDKSEDLAKKFALEHGLDFGMTEKLKELLDQQINSLLTKIDEEYEDEN
ncbi:hypothetical protein pb186bvf_015434 [Paramecium bursaria]